MSGLASVNDASTGFFFALVFDVSELASVLLTVAIIPVTSDPDFVIDRTVFVNDWSSSKFKIECSFLTQFVTSSDESAAR